MIGRRGCERHTRFWPGISASSRRMHACMLFSFSLKEMIWRYASNNQWCSQVSLSHEDMAFFDFLWAFVTDQV